MNYKVLVECNVTDDPLQLYSYTQLTSEAKCILSELKTYPKTLDSIYNTVKGAGFERWEMEVARSTMLFAQYISEDSDGTLYLTNEGTELARLSETGWIVTALWFEGFKLDMIEEELPTIVAELLSPYSGERTKGTATYSNGPIKIEIPVKSQKNEALMSAQMRGAVNNLHRWRENA